MNLAKAKLGIVVALMELAVDGERNEHPPITLTDKDLAIGEAFEVRQSIAAVCADRGLSPDEVMHSMRRLLWVRD